MTVLQVKFHDSFSQKAGESTIDWNQTRGIAGASYSD